MSPGGTARAVPFGDRAVLVTTGDTASAHALAAAVSARARRDAPDPPPVRVAEVTVGFASVLAALGSDPGPGDLDAAAAWLLRVAAGTGTDGGTGVDPATHVLPVTFDGADLDTVAETLGCPPDDVVGLLSGADLEVAFLGFTPGFPYLTGLPEALAGLPRRDTPRTAVPAGSVAVAGGFAAVYPQATPGGWNLLGHTDVPLFDPRTPPYARLAPGDRVRFEIADGPVDALTDPGHRPGAPSDRPPSSGSGLALDVVTPGFLDLVQDAGRPAVAGLGVPRAGAADPRALALVNRLLGNEPGAAALEVTGSGPVLRVVGAGHLAVVGPGPGCVEVRVDGHQVADGAVVPVSDGQVVSVGRVTGGLRAYVGVSGGLATPVLLGSRSHDVLSGLGPGPAAAGDRLARGTPGRVRGHLDLRPLPGPSPRTAPAVLRVLPGPHAVGTGRAGLDRVAAGRWRVGAEVDRVGIRLDHVDGPASGGGVPVASIPMVTGAVQLPPDGRPIVLLPDHATVGGYPVVACVISADLPVLGQLAPGDLVSFVPVGHDDAREARLRSVRAVRSAVTGWFPTAAGT